MKILITGTDGYIGSRLARVLLEQGRELVLWVRAGDSPTDRQKDEFLNEFLKQYPNKFTIVRGDLSEPQPFESVKPEALEAIVHSAAVTRFNVEADIADTVNRDGAEKLMQFARNCPQLKQLCLLSTVYSTGTEPGAIAEQPSSPRAFANHYERSKCETEALLTQQYSDLPWTIARISTIISDDESGLVSQFNVFHNTARLLYHGLISLLPGAHDTPIYLITGQFAIDILEQLATQPGAHGIHHLCHSAEKNPTLQQLIDCLFDEFSKDPVFQQKRIIPPLLSDRESFENVASLLEKGLGGALVQQSLSSIRPFSDQLYINKDFANQSIREYYPSLDAWDWRTVVPQVVQYLISSKWGREPYQPKLS